MVKAIFVDLDATLLSDDKTISNKNIKAIKKVMNDGIKFLYCTGRLPFCYAEYNYLDLTDFISANGGVIIKDNKILYTKYLSKLSKVKILDYVINNEDYTRMFALDALYLINANKQNIKSNIYPNTKSLNNDEASNLVNKIDIVKFGFINKDIDRLEEIRKDIEMMNIDVELFYSGENYLEVCPKGVNKGEGIKKYCELNNIDIKDTIGIGDNDNDKSMLKTVGLAACPSNAIDSIKQMAHFVSKFDNNEGAVADIIEKYAYK